MNHIGLAAIQYQAIRDRLWAIDPQLMRRRLPTLGRGSQDLHEILAAVVRAALTTRPSRRGSGSGSLSWRNARPLSVPCRQTPRNRPPGYDHSEIKKVVAPDLTLLIRPGTRPSSSPTGQDPGRSLEAQCSPSTGSAFFQSLKLGTAIQGAELSHPDPVMSVRTK